MKIKKKSLEKIAYLGLFKDTEYPQTCGHWQGLDGSTYLKSNYFIIVSDK